MRLTTIKLSGFKSFVDPTTLHLPTNMTGIVGPNGCGKSNIIDAIRWVMGESAASRLRGDNLSDVIFSGSGGRKPVGTATVELIFDNSEGLVGGEYARFNEISVKRSVSRDSQSSYFLNGCALPPARHRRRVPRHRPRRAQLLDHRAGHDLADRRGAARGTAHAPGGGRRHLQVQGAAQGDRVADQGHAREPRPPQRRAQRGREELEHLNRQARAAERWQKLKAGHARVEAELKALSLKAHEAELAGKTEALQALELEIEKHVAEQRHVEAQLEGFRERQLAATDQFNRVQAEVYRVGSEIARVEQQIQHNKDLAERLARAGKETEAQLAEVIEHLRADHEQVATLGAALAGDEPRIAALAGEADARAEALKGAEQALADWQLQWDAYAKASGEAARATEVERTRLDYLDKQSIDISRRLEQLEAERAAERRRCDRGRGQGTGRRPGDPARAARGTYGRDGAAQGAPSRRCSKRRSTPNPTSPSAASSSRPRRAACRRWRPCSTRPWGMRPARPSSSSNRWDWPASVASARCSRSAMAGSARSKPCCPAGSMACCTTPRTNSRRGSTPWPRPTSRWSAPGWSSPGRRVPWPAWCAARRRSSALLARVRIAESLGQAQELARRLPAGESVVTPNGEWMGADWVRVIRGGGAQVGVLAREREIHALGSRARGAGARSGRADRAPGTDQGPDRRGRTARATRPSAISTSGTGACRRSPGSCRTSRAGSTRRSSATRRSAWNPPNCKARLAEVEEQTRGARGQLDAGVTRMGDLEAERVRLDAHRRELLERREEARIEARESREQAHQLALQVESRRAALRSLEQALARMASQQASLQARAGEIAEQLATGGQPIAELEAERKVCLDQRLLVDRQLVEARKALEDLDSETRQVDVERHRVERLLGELRERLSAQRLEEQGTRLRAESLAQAIAEAGFDVAAIAAELAPEAEAGAWQAKLEELDGKIRRLEPVNLAAIQEHGEQSERKQYLDAQLTDLTTALETLEGAIRKIDKETRTRFKETFDKVNQGVRRAVPAPVRRRPRLPRARRRRPARHRRDHHGAPAGQARDQHLAALGRREGADRGGAGVRDLPSQPGAVLPARRGRRAAGRGQRGPLLQHGHRDVRAACSSSSSPTTRSPWKPRSQLCGVTMREAGVSRLVTVDLAEATKLAGAA